MMGSSCERHYKTNYPQFTAEKVRRLCQMRPPPQGYQQSPPSPSGGNFDASAFGDMYRSGGPGQNGGGVFGGGSGMSDWAGGATPLLYAYLIGKGKSLENDRLKKYPDDPLGNVGLGLLGPSISQALADPKGMGLPTLLGLPFLTPFTASDAAKQKSPWFKGILGL